MSWVRPNGEIFPQPSTHTANAQLLDAVMVIVGQKLIRKGSVPGTCGVGIHYAIRSPTVAFF